MRVISCGIKIANVLLTFLCNLYGTTAEELIKTDITIMCVLLFCRCDPYASITGAFIISDVLIVLVLSICRGDPYTSITGAFIIEYVAFVISNVDHSYPGHAHQCRRQTSSLYAPIWTPVIPFCEPL